VSVHTTRIRPLFADTDAAGVVYYGAYLRMLEEARTQAIESVGLSIGEEYRLGYLYAVTRVEIDYQNPVLYGQVLCIASEVAEVGRVRFRVDHRLYLEDGLAPIGRASVHLACLHGPERRPARLSEGMAAALAALRPGD
jgi:acyl-CoA thioester hydrolase